MITRKTFVQTSTATAAVLLGAGLLVAPAQAQPAATGQAHEVHGAIGERYNSEGGAATFGEPLTPEIGFADGVVRQDFTGGSFYWSPASGAHFVKNSGAISGAYAQDLVHTEPGAGVGSLGVPTTDETCATAVPASIMECEQTFANGAITWNELGGVRLVEGEIFAAWNGNSAPTERGGTVGQLSPVSDAFEVGDGVVQSFALADGGRGVIASSPAGTFFIDADTAAGQWYLNHGGIQELGFPISQVVKTDSISVLPLQDGAISADFVNGELVGAFIPNP